jgi:tryptophanyl-tRNA synthetase
MEMFVLVADYQVLTDRDVADRLSEHVSGLVLDYLAIGIDPARSSRTAPFRPSTSCCCRSSAWSPSRS